MGDELTPKPNETASGNRAQTSGADAAELPVGQGYGGQVMEDATSQAGHDERVPHGEGTSGREPGDGASRGASVADGTEYHGAGYGGPEMPASGATPDAV